MPEQKTLKPLFADILLQYSCLIPEVVCENCQDDLELQKCETSNTGYYCQACDSFEVNYQRESFIEDVNGCEEDMQSELSQAVQKAKQEIAKKVLMEKEYLSVGLVEYLESITQPKE